MRYLIMCFIALSLAACTTTIGKKFDPSKFSHFVKGKTTYAEVISELGEPNSVSNNADGTKVITYGFNEVKIRPETYIPLVGGFIGGADTKLDVARMSFNKKEILTDYTYSGSKM